MDCVLLGFRRTIATATTLVLVLHLLEDDVGRGGGRPRLLVSLTVTAAA
jgi:hypothetical protein